MNKKRNLMDKNNTVNSTLKKKNITNLLCFTRCKKIVMELKMYAWMESLQEA